MTATQALTLTDFLLARIAEDEERLVHEYDCDRFNVSHSGRAGDCDCSATGRVLSECEAKRRIMERCGAVDFAMPSTHLAHGILGELAAVYADHPDYRDEWADRG